MSSNKSKYNFFGVASSGANEAVFGVGVIQSNKLEFFRIVQVVDLGYCSLFRIFINKRL